MERKKDERREIYIITNESVFFYSCICKNWERRISSMLLHSNISSFSKQASKKATLFIFIYAVAMYEREKLSPASRHVSLVARHTSVRRQTKAADKSVGKVGVVEICW